jgi:nucleoid DNA-binding protein
MPNGGGDEPASYGYLTPTSDATSITKAPLTVSDSVSGISGSVDVDGWLTVCHFRSTEFHSARTIDPDIGRATQDDDADGDGFPPDEAVAYLEDDAVIGERFLLSLPDANLPGGSTPMATFSPTQLLDAVTDGDNDADGRPEATVEFKPGAELANKVKLAGVRTPVRNAAGDKGIDKASPKLYSALASENGERGQGLPDEWPGTYSVKGGTVSNSLLAGATVSVEGEDDSTVELPALLHMKRIKHGEDYLFDGGWMLDAGQLYSDAATVLVASGPNQLVGLSSDELAEADDAQMRDRLPSDRSRLGGRVYTGPATADMQPFLPDGLRDGVGLGRFASVSKRSARKGRNPQTGKEIKIPAKRVATMSHMVGLVRAGEGRWACGDDASGRCRKVRTHADIREGLLKRVEAYRAAGEERLAHEALQEVRAIVQVDIDLLSSVEDQQAVGDLLGLERALRREIDLTLDPVTGDPGQGDDFPMAIEVAVVSQSGEIPGDDDGDGIWDGIDTSAVAGEVSSEELRIDGQRAGIGHTFALREGRKGMNAVDVRRVDLVADGENDRSDPPRVRHWDTYEEDPGKHAVTLTVVTDAEGQLMNKAELIDSIASEADIRKRHARRALDAFIDTTTKLHAGIEKDQVKRGMVVTEPAAGGEKESGEEYFVHAMGLIDEIRDEDDVSFEMLKPTIVPLDAPLVHLTTSTKSLPGGDRTTLIGVGSDSPD